MIDNKSQVHISHKPICLVKTHLCSQTVDTNTNFYQIYKNDDNFFIKGDNSKFSYINGNPLINGIKELLSNEKPFANTDIYDKFLTDSGSKYFVKWLLSKDCDHEKWIQLSSKGEIISYMTMTHNEFNNKPSFFISELFVCKKFRGSGYCLNMLKFAENRAIEQEKEQIVLNCFAANEKAYKTYLKYGFVPFQRSV